MATTSELLRYAMEVDPSGAVDGFKKVSKAGDESADDVAGSFDGLESKFDKVGGGMGRKLATGFAAIGAGAIMVDQINQAFERLDARNILQGQFDLSAQEAAEFGSMAGDLYAGGFGDSVQSLQTIAATATRDLGVTANNGLDEITKGIAAVAKTWEVDFSEVIRATQQLLTNGLAPDAQTALDIIVGGFQNGGDRAGDMLDTLIEYAPRWRAVGLDGEAAMTQIVTAMDAGIFQADKVGDAVKEMSVRITEGAEPTREALQNIGLDADQITQAFLEGGPAARDAFQAVIDALARGQRQGDDTADAVAILGTQFEDLGPEALEALGSIDASFDPVIGDAKALAETVRATDWEQFKREGQTALAGLASAIVSEAAPALEGLNVLIDVAQGEFEALQDDGGKATAAIRQEMLDLGWSVEEVNEMLGEAPEHLSRMGDGIDTSTVLMRRYRDEMKIAAMQARDMSDDSTEAMGLVAESIEDARDEFELAQDNIRRFGDDGVEQMDRVVEKVEEVEDAFAGLRGEISEREYLRDLQDQFDRVGAAAVRAMEGGEKEARDHQRALDDLRLDVLDLTERYDDIPPEKLTRILADIDAGKLDQAERQLKHLVRSRTMLIQPVVGPSSGRVGAGGVYARHSGGRVSPGQLVQPLSGEAFVADQPGTVLSRRQTTEAGTGAGLDSGGAAMVVVEFAGANFYGSPPDPWAEELAEQIERIAEAKL